MRPAPLALLLAAAVTSSGCAATDAVLARFNEPEEIGPAVVTISVLAPLSGGGTREGTGVLDAVEQAVADSDGVPGWQVEVEPIDLAQDDLDETLAELKTDDTTVAVVTGFTAEDIRTVVPELDESGLTVLSPVDTDPRHTRGADPSAPLRPWAGYLTVAVEPTPEQTALADQLARVRGVTRAVVVGDGSTQSRARARVLADALTERGVVDTTVVSWRGEKQTRPLERALAGLEQGDVLAVDADPELAAEIATRRPDGVLLALTSPADDLSRREAKELDGAFAPLPGLDPRRGLDDLQQLYSAAGSDATISAFGPAAYDGARLLVDTFSRCLPDPERTTSPSRSACRAEVAGATWNGLTGRTQFDEYGTRLGLLPAVVRLRDGSWEAPGGESR
jgi:branched-chain amino acid transport system substrate-binding protein